MFQWLMVKPPIGHIPQCKTFALDIHTCWYIRGDVKIPTYKPHTNHKKPSVSSHTLVPTSICDLSHSVGWGPLTDLGHIYKLSHLPLSSLWFVCGHRKGISTSPPKSLADPMQILKFVLLSFWALSHWVHLGLT